MADVGDSIAGGTVEGATAASGPLPDEWWQHHFDPHSPELAPCLYQTLASMREPHQCLTILAEPRQT